MLQISQRMDCRMHASTLKIPIILLIFLLIASGVQAYFPSEPVPYAIEFDNGEIFIMTDKYPKDDMYIQNSLGIPYKKSGLYYKDSTTEMKWTFDFYAYENELFYLEDAEHFARINGEPIVIMSDEIGLSFYRNGELVKQYTVKQLTNRFREVRELVGNTCFWVSGSKIINEELHLTNIEGQTYIFNMKTGEIVGVKKIKNGEEIFVSKNSSNNIYWWIAGLLSVLFVITVSIFICKKVAVKNHRK